MSTVYTNKMSDEQKKEYDLQKFFKIVFFTRVMEMITVQKLKDKVLKKYDNLATYLFEGVEVNDYTMELAIKKLREIFYDPHNVHEDCMPVLLFNSIIDSINKVYPSFVGTSYAKTLKEGVKGFHDEILLEKAEERAMLAASKNLSESDPDDFDLPLEEWPTNEESEGPIWDDSTL